MSQLGLLTSSGIATSNTEISTYSSSTVPPLFDAFTLNEGNVSSRDCEMLYSGFNGKDKVISSGELSPFEITK